MKRLVVFAALIFLLLPTVSQASAPVWGGTGKTLPKGWWYFENHSLIFQLDEAWQDGQWVRLPDGQQVFIHLNLSQIYYGVFNNLTLRLNVPFYWTLENGLKQKDYHYLLGDITLDSKFRIIKKAHLSFSLIPGINFASGDKQLQPFDSDKTFIDFFHGYNLTAELFLIDFHHYLIHWVKTADLPDYLQYNFALNITLIRNVDLCFEWDGKHWMGSLDGKRSLGFCLGVQYHPTDNTPCLEISFRRPVNNKGGLRNKETSDIYFGFGYFWGK